MSKKIKDEQKKLLGQTLNEYDKTLKEGIKQLDKKNREQNHKISALTNSFDNDFLEKEEEGTMISLENSKDGMVIIDEIAGNSEVNYCKDGVTELTLNGDIDTQGESSVTITEGVDGGLVDVVIEGNTEINMSNTKDPVMVTHMFDEFTNNGGKLQTTVDDVTTYDSMVGKIDIKNIKGDTLVNHAVNGNEELILNGDIDVSGDNFITIDTGAEGGKVDVALEGNTLVNVSKTKDVTPITHESEDVTGNHIALANEGSIRPVLNGNTMVNVCNQKDPVAITKSYTVETGNHVALQGEYDGKCRPVVTGNTLVNLVDTIVEKNIIGKCYDVNLRYTNAGNTYTVIFNASFDESVPNNIGFLNNADWDTRYTNILTQGFNKIILNTTENNSNILRIRVDNNSQDLEVTDLVILEGDYTNKPIPDYFQGLQSSFEDKVVTQEMVDAGEEVAENLGKYKVDYVISKEDGTVGETKTFYLNSPLLEGDTIEQQGDNVVHVHRYGKVVLVGSDDEQWIIQDIPDSSCIGVYSNISLNTSMQLVTCDTIPSIHTTWKITGENIFIHLSGKININIDRNRLQTQDLNGFKQWLQSNPVTVVYKLKTPQYEVISQNDTILCDSYVNGHLDVDSVVPIERVNFIPTQLSPLKYVYENTKYTIQFESDNVGKIDYLMIGQETKVNIDVIKGINKINITTFSTSPYIDFRGIGFNASNIVVTPAIEQEFDYFSGMQSCFEDKVVTQEMVDAGEELAENLGKYKVDYVVTGKNKCPIKSFTSKFFTGDVKNHIVSKLNLARNITYTLSIDETNTAQRVKVYHGDNEGNLDAEALVENWGVTLNPRKFITPNKEGTYWLIIYGDGATINNIQIEEGTEATPYEPYKEYTKTFYLNSPLLEGDTIEERNGSVYHVHRYDKVLLDGVSNSRMHQDREGEFNDDNTMLKVPYFRPDIKEVGDATEYDNSFCDKLCWKPDIPKKASDTPCYGRGSTYWRLMISIPVTTDSDEAINTYLQSNPLTFVLPLVEPRYELIEQSNLAIPSYVNGHLDFGTAIPVSKVNFLHFEEELTYLYPATSYTVQFILDRAITADVNLGGTQLLAQNIVVGLNRISITTPDTLVDNKLVIDGAGAKIRDIVVTEATDQDFGYFEGMKSVGECEDLEVVSRNKNLWDYNKIKPTSSQYLELIYSNKNNLTISLTDKDTSVDISGCAFGYGRNGSFWAWMSTEDGSIITNANMIRIYPNSQKTIDKLNARFNIQIEEGNTATDYIPHTHNTQTLTHEPLRAVGDTKDKYVLIDGKWYIERNCAEYIIPQDTVWTKTPHMANGNYVRYKFNMDSPIDIKYNYLDSRQIAKSSILPFGYPNHWTSCSRNEIQIISKDSNELYIQVNLSTIEQVASLLNGSSIIYPKNAPTYEPIDYSPFTVYSDITHISNNSTIPCNMIIKNHGYNMVALKENTQYTLYVDKNTTNALTYRLGDYVEINSLSKFTFTTPATLTDKTLRITGKGNSVKDLMLIEGTPANDPVGYFDGLKSSYECEKVTDESDENYGKYKVNIKVVGKNLFDKDKAVYGYPVNGSINNNGAYKGFITSDYIDVKNIDTICIGNITSSRELETVRIHNLDKNKKLVSTIMTSSEGIPLYYQIPPNTSYVRISLDFRDTGGVETDITGITYTCQIEQGDTATEYEPYFESKQTVYLNSPLLKGDEIVWKDNKIQHYHKMDIREYQEGDIELYPTDKVNTLIPLETPYYEEISLYPLKFNTKENCSLTTESTIQVTNISFNVYEETLPYLYPNTKYYVSFNADISREIVVDLGGTEYRMTTQVGYNKVEITTPADTTNMLTFNGQGININHVMVTRQDIDEYFEGMKSVGECENNTLEIICKNNDNSKSNTQTLTHEPLRAVGNIKDKYVLIDGKWYIERNIICIDTTSTTDNIDKVISWGWAGDRDTEELATISIKTNKYFKTNSNLLSNAYVKPYLTNGNWLNFKVKKSELSSTTITNDILKEWCYRKKVIICAQLQTPQYELIDYNPFEVYSDITHISNNSLIPSNMVIKNHGYNTILKPSTKYTVALNKPSGTISAKLGGSAKVDSTNSVFTITTPSTLNDNVLRLSGSGRVKDIIILEGDKTINTPSYFEGIESAFEQELITDKNDKHFGKYRVNAKVVGKNLLNIPRILSGTMATYNSLLFEAPLKLKKGTYTISFSSIEEPTNSVNIIKICNHNDAKNITVVQRPTKKSTFTLKEDTEIDLVYMPRGAYTFTELQIEQGDEATSYEPYKENNITFYIDEPLRGVENNKDKVFIQDNKVVVQRNCASLVLDGDTNIDRWSGAVVREGVYWYDFPIDNLFALNNKSKVMCNTLICDPQNSHERTYTGTIGGVEGAIRIVSQYDTQDFKQWLQQNPTTVVYQLAEPVYELADYDLSKLVLENYENSSLIFESNIPVSANIRYSGEVPVVTQAKTLSSQVDNTTLDINENIIPYMCDMDYRIIELQLNGDTQGEGIELLGIGDIEILGNNDVLFNNREVKKYNFSYDMLKRDIISNRYSKEEYQYRLDRYLLAEKISDEEYKELEGLLNNGE